MTIAPSEWPTSVMRSVSEHARIASIGQGVDTDPPHDRLDVAGQMQEGVARAGLARAQQIEEGHGHAVTQAPRGPVRNLSQESESVRTGSSPIAAEPEFALIRR